MDRYFKRLASKSHSPSSSSESSPSPLGETQRTQCRASQVPLNHTSSSTQRSRVDVSNPANGYTISYYKNHLNAFIDVARLLLISGLPFGGHDESETSIKKGNFLTILEFFAKKNESVGSVVLKNDLRNNHMIFPSIQKDIVNAFYKETIHAILEELGDDYFAILVDESRDVSCKQHMNLVLRYVDKRGFVMERLVGVAHVTSTTAQSLKGAIYSMLAQLSLSPSRIRGQAYDGASNMRGHIHGLRKLVQEDCASAHYVHCFAHELQLTLVKVAYKHVDVARLIDLINLTLNTIGVSYKCRDEFQRSQVEMVAKALYEGDLVPVKGLNQEVALQRPGDTHWDAVVGVCSIDERFSNLATLGDLSKALVRTGLCDSCPNFFKLLKLALILLISTATVERVFSAMKFIKTELCNNICDEFLNDAAVTYFEYDLFHSLSNEDILGSFQNMKKQREHLP